MKKGAKTLVWVIALIITVVLFILFIALISGILSYYYFSNEVKTYSAAVVSAPFYLTAWKVDTAGVSLELKNNGGEDYTIKSVEVSGCGKTTPQAAISEGEIRTFNITCSLTKGEAFKEDITITYSKENSALDLASTGSMTQTVG